MSVRVRFAPSPTGFLHVGGARTALYNYLWARNQGGTFILRIEDTDEERSTEASVEQIYESLRWLGLNWDEGPIRQSDRMDRYEEHMARLERSGHLYRAFDTKEELDEMRERARLEKRNPIYDRRALKLTPAQVEEKLRAGVPWVWRFRVPDSGTTIVPDTLQGEGECRFENADIGDFIINRPGTGDRPGMPLYNFCCVVDDAEMNITHVIRGADHLSNSARQVLMFQALGYPIPKYTHLPLILKAGKKMSKRDNDADPRYPVSVSARRDLGYLPEATINFLALLGWSADGENEIHSREELIRAFSLDRLSKSNANFDEDKYLFMNGWYMRHLPREVIVARARPFLDRAGLSAPGRGDDWYAFIIGLEIERCRLLSEFPEALRYFFEAPASYDPAAVRKIMKDGAAELLAAAGERLAALAEWSIPAMEGAIKGLAGERQVGLGKVAQPIRLAVSGRTATPGLFEVLHALGREETLARIRALVAAA